MRREEVALVERGGIGAGNKKPGVGDLLNRVKGAFDQFEGQSTLLRSAFDGLKKNLANANAELNTKNEALSVKLRELEHMSRRLQCVLQSLTDGVLVVDQTYRVERVNPVAVELLNRKGTRVTGKPYTEIANGLGSIDALRDAVERGRTMLDQERSHVTPDGQRVVVLASVAPIQGSEGHAIGAVEVLRDITELRALEARVQHQKRMVALGEMAASVAHEIRNPLGTIEGFARLLKHDLEEEGRPEYTRLTEKIVEGTQNLNYVIANLLTYARPMTLACEFFQGEPLLRNVKETLQPYAEEHGVSLLVAPAGGRERPYGDRRQLAQVLVNLGRNAIEASGDDGEVIISSAVHRRSAVWRVADRGDGIAKEDIGRLFDPFFTRKEGGTGLGLSLCHKIVLAPGGEIGVERERGNGTVFTVTLPRSGGKLS